MTFEQFQTIVRDFWPNAGEIGSFRDFSPEFIDCEYEPGRIYYTWQNHEGFGAVAYDSKDNPKPWYVDNGRGSGAYGETIEIADKTECDRYDNFIANLQH